MRFVRVYTRSDTGEIVTVTERDSPFTNQAPVKFTTADGSIAFEVEEHEMVVDQFDPASPDISPARHLFERMHHEGGGRFAAKPQCEIPSIIDCPASIDGIKAVLRACGPEGIPVKVRAWLANILPPDKVAALGIGRRLPISAMKAAEALRTKRDPAGGSRLEHLERIAQRQSDAMAKAALLRRMRRAQLVP